MLTASWIRTATIDGEEWEFGLAQGRLDLWRNRVLVRTVYSDNRDIIWDTDQWPEEIVAAWQEMLDVMRREAGQ